MISLPATDKTNQTIEGVSDDAEDEDGFVTLTFNGEVKFSLSSSGKRHVHLELATLLPEPTVRFRWPINWPSWFEIRVIRHLASGPDETARQTITVPPKRGLGLVYNDALSIKAGVPHSLEFRHDGPVPIVLHKRILKVDGLA